MAKEIGGRFLFKRFPRAKIDFNGVMPVRERHFPLYHLEGKITMPSCRIISKLVSPPEQYILNIEVDILGRRLLDWELK